MSDYNVVVGEVDTAMDMLEALKTEVQDVRARACFDVSSLMALVEQKVNGCLQEIEDSTDTCDEQRETDARQYRLEERLERLLSIQASCEQQGTALTEQLNDACRCMAQLVDTGLHEMGDYIRKLNRICGIQQTAFGYCAPNGQGTYVCVIDSARYPQTAEHIRVAQNMGFPSLLTLDRDNAANRRKASLEGVRVNRLYDRDEYPCAVFREGGAGADVVYVEGSDNRGAGASMRWQMQHIPDGAQVRIRVI